MLVAAWCIIEFSLVKVSHKLLSPLHDLIQPLLASKQHLASFQNGAAGVFLPAKLVADLKKSRRL